MHVRMILVWVSILKCRCSLPNTSRDFMNIQIVHFFHLMVKDAQANIVGQDNNALFSVVILDEM